MRMYAIHSRFMKFSLGRTDTELEVETGSQPHGDS